MGWKIFSKDMTDSRIHRLAPPPDYRWLIRLIVSNWHTMAHNGPPTLSWPLTFVIHFFNYKCQFNWGGKNDDCTFIVGEVRERGGEGEKIINIYKTFRIGHPRGYGRERALARHSLVSCKCEWKPDNRFFSIWLKTTELRLKIHSFTATGKKG